MDLMALRFPGEAFGMRAVSSGSDNEMMDEDDLPENYIHDPFKDIRALQGISFSDIDNLIPIHQFTTKEDKAKPQPKKNP